MHRMHTVCVLRVVEGVDGSRARASFVEGTLDGNVARVHECLYRSTKSGNTDAHVVGEAVVRRMGPVRVPTAVAIQQGKRPHGLCGDRPGPHQLYRHHREVKVATPYLDLLVVSRLGGFDH